MKTREQLLTELLGECFHDPVRIKLKGRHRQWRCLKCKVILLYHIETLDFSSGAVFFQLLKFTQTSIIDPGGSFRSFWESFCLGVGGAYIGGLPTLPVTMLDPLTFANRLCDFLIKHHPDYIKMVEKREKERWSHD